LVYAIFKNGDENKEPFVKNKIQNLRCFGHGFWKNGNLKFSFNKLNLFKPLKVFFLKIFKFLESSQTKIIN
jgi:hypothetical protein